MTDPTPEPPDTALTVEGRWFEDVRVAAGIGLDRDPADGYENILDRGSGGVCVLDVDGAGTLDIFFAIRPTPRWGPTLYVASEPWSYHNETAARGLSEVGDASSCLAFDLEGDGDDDLLVVGDAGRLFRNDGGIFVDVSERLEGRFIYGGLYTSAAAGDVDGDGDVDLLVAGYVLYDPDRFEPDEMCGPANCASQPHQFDRVSNILMIQDDEGRFEDLTAELAPRLTQPFPGLLAAITDLTGDGVPELYIGNDLSEPAHAMVRQADGTFVDQAEELGLAWDRLGSGLDAMGWTSADFDGNGWLDHTVTSFTFEASGVWMCGEGGAAEGVVCEEQADAAGTLPLANTFRWANAAADFDNDGWPDLIEATGHIFTEAEAADFFSGATGESLQRPNFLRNDGTGRLVWVEEPESGDALAMKMSMRGLTAADLDDDGRLDVVMTPSSGHPAVFKNVRPPVGHWLRIVLGAPGPARTTLNSWVEVTTADGQLLQRERRAGEGYCGSFDPRLHFGLPTDEPVSVTVRWPWGETTTLADVAVDAELVIAPP